MNEMKYRVKNFLFNTLIRLIEEIEYLQKDVAKVRADRALHLKWPGVRTDRLLNEAETLDFLIAFYDERATFGKKFELNPSEMLGMRELLKELRDRRAKDTK